MTTFNPFPLPGHCLYPLGNPNDPNFHFCSKPVQDSRSSYCEEHHKIVHQQKLANEVEPRGTELLCGPWSGKLLLDIGWRI